MQLAVSLVYGDSTRPDIMEASPQEVRAMALDEPYDLRVLRVRQCDVQLPHAAIGVGSSTLWKT
jgi:hypothetical protein